MKNLQQIIIDFMGTDRLMHFAFGGWIACLAPTWFYAPVIGLSVGILKEIFDKWIKKSSFDWWDLIATFGGSIVTAIVMLIFAGG